MEIKEKLAFTLAEVLITLGVIGVVAAITIPGLITSYNKKITETRLAKFYSVFNQAIRLSVAENGDVDTWDDYWDNDGIITGGQENQTGVEKAFDTYLRPYMQIAYKREYTMDKIKYYMYYQMEEHSHTTCGEQEILHFSQKMLKNVLQEISLLGHVVLCLYFTPSQKQRVGNIIIIKD